MRSSWEACSSTHTHTHIHTWQNTHVHRSTHPLGAKQAERSAAVSHTQWSRQCKTGPSSIQIPWQPSGNYILLNNAPPHFLPSLMLCVFACVCHMSAVEEVFRSWTWVKAQTLHWYSSDSIPSKIAEDVNQVLKVKVLIIMYVVQSQLRSIWL